MQYKSVEHMTKSIWLLVYKATHIIVLMLSKAFILALDDLVQVIRKANAPLTYYTFWTEKDLFQFHFALRCFEFTEGLESLSWLPKLATAF